MLRTREFAATLPTYGTTRCPESVAQCSDEASSVTLRDPPPRGLFMAAEGG
jgi:hypothetical protein